MNEVNETRKRTALVVGATGLVGREVVRQLLEEKHYERVIVWVRRELPYHHEKLKQIIIDFPNLVSQSEALGDGEKPEFIDEDVDDVFCCLGTTIKTAGSQEKFRYVDVELPIAIAQLCRHQRMKTFLIISAIGANAKSSVFYSRMKGIVEQQLVAMNLPKLFIFRPSFLVGKREELRVGEKIGIGVFSALSFLMHGPLKNYRPVRDEQVARAMIHSALSVQQKDGDQHSVTVLENRDILKITEPRR